MIQAFRIGFVTFHIYGLILGLALLASWEWIQFCVRRNKLSVPLLETALLSAIGGGIIGARAYHVIDYWSYYSHHLGEIGFVWHGGLGIWGAVVGGMIGLWWVTRSHFLEYADVIVLGLPLGQAIGRWGNWVNYELFGLPTTLPWGIFIPMAYRPIGYEQFAYFHPLFLYESLGSLLLFCLLGLVVFKKSIKKGELLGLYLIGYSILRMSLEPLRIGNWHIGDIATASLVGIGSLLIGMWLIWRSRIRV